jgi:hypothetical protein
MRLLLFLSALLSALAGAVDGVRMNPIAIQTASAATSAAATLKRPVSTIVQPGPGDLRLVGQAGVPFSFARDIPSFGARRRV